MAILQPPWLPSAAQQPQVVLQQRRTNMANEQLYDPNNRANQEAMGQPTEDQPTSADYISAQLAKYAGRPAVPQLDPGARVKMPNTAGSDPGNYKGYYDMLASINDRGNAMLATAQARAAYQRQQAASAALSGGSSGGGGSGNTNVGNPNVNFKPGKGVAQWTDVTLQAMHMLNIPDSYLNAILRRMNQESGGNPGIQNNWDSNAKKGTPSIGLMQTIAPTFNAYAGSLKGRGITDPLANIYAGLNYAGTRYGKSHGGFLGGVLYAMNKSGGY